MIGLLFHIEQGRHTVGREVWDYVCRTYGMTLLSVEVADAAIAPRAIKPQLRFPSIEAARKEFVGYTWVWAVPEGDIPGSPVYGGPPGSHKPAIPYTYLHDFDHPEDNVIYIFGPDGGELRMRERFQPGDKVINILTVDRITQMHAIVAGASVAYDVRAKGLKKGLWQQQH